MKKVFFAMALIMSVMMVMACASKPMTQEEAQAAIENIYAKYKTSLIYEGAETYVVKGGDRLSAIAHEFYGNGFYFPLVMLASSDVVKDPDKIQPDMELIIPDLQRNLDDARAKKSIKDFLVEIAKVYDRREGRENDAQGLRDLAASL